MNSNLIYCSLEEAISMLFPVYCGLKELATINQNGNILISVYVSDLFGIPYGKINYKRLVVKHEGLEYLVTVVNDKIKLELI